MIAIACFLLLIWLLATEGSFVSNRLTLFWYNCFAGRYEQKWKHTDYADPKTQSRLFERPLHAALRSSAESRMLDLACGTGRMSRLVLETGWFAGRITAIDASREMLNRFRSHLGQTEPNVENHCQLQCRNLTRWQGKEPASFDAVTLMEASEFLPRFSKIIGEVHRVLKPGGLLLLTKVADRWSWLFPGRRQSAGSMRRLLDCRGYVNVHIAQWSRRYDVVYAWKPHGSGVG